MKTMYGQEFGFSNWQCGIFGFLPGPLGMVISILFWVMIIALIVKLISYFFPSQKGKTGAKSLDILNQRYAADKISRSEFEKIKRDISVQP
jgi:uncharacterized membrane protein